jgi:type VI secretion system protein ImpE
MGHASRRLHAELEAEMNAAELFREGRLGEAVAAQTSEVKSRPLDSDARFLLFVLLSFAGELERAEAQLEAAVVGNDELQMGSLVYRSLLGSEFERRKVYRGESEPVFPPDPPPTLRLRLTALRALATGDVESAGAALAEAEENGVALSGKLNGAAYDGLRDYDDLLGQVLEVYTGGRYLWLPLERVRRLTLQPPRTHIDLLWATAELVDTDDRTVNVYIPALYEGSHEHPDEGVRLGRETTWIDRGVGMRGAGQRVLYWMSGETERETPLLELRSLESGEG